MLNLKLRVKLLIFFVGIWNVHCEDLGYFWHITDIHVDQNYSRTGNVHNLCHEDIKSFPDSRPNISDNGLYGNFLCDSPQNLVNVTVAFMNASQSSPDFIIWTGDNLPHTEDFDPDWDITFEAMRNITLLLKSTFPNVPILPCIGNHDTFPPNILPADSSSSNIYKGYLEKGRWKDLLNESEWSTFVQGGYYSHVLKPGFRIISLNTILWYSPNDLTSKISDPGNQFQWLDGVLKKSSKLAEKVYIIGHVPPGYFNRALPGQKGMQTFHTQHLEPYLSILSKYSPIIAGQFYGHYHLDMFQVFQYNTGTFKGSSLLAPSVTPWHVNNDTFTLPVNPSIRLMHYSRNTIKLLDYDQYYLNLTKANSMKNVSEEPKNLYELLYTFTKFYGVPDLSTESLVTVYEALKNNQTKFDSFFTFLTVGKSSETCDDACKVAQICSMACASTNEYDLCMKSSDHVCDTPNSSKFSEGLVILYLVMGSVFAVVGLILLILYKRYWTYPSRNHYTAFSSI